MDIDNFKKAIAGELAQLSWPQRLNGFQILFFESSSEVRQYSTGLPPSKFRDNLQGLLDEIIRHYEEKRPCIRETDIDAELKKDTGKSAPRLPPVDFLVTVLKQPPTQVQERWWTVSSRSY